MQISKVNAGKIRMTEGELFSSIEKYIVKNKFPKNLVLKKFDVMTKSLTDDNRNRIKLIESGHKALQVVEVENNSLRSECREILDQLRMELKI